MSFTLYLVFEWILLDGQVSSLSFQGVQNANLEIDRFCRLFKWTWERLLWRDLELLRNVFKVLMDGSLKLIWKDQKSGF